MNKLSTSAHRLLIVLIICVVSALTPVCSGQSAIPSAANVTLVTDEAEAVLAILTKRKANQPIVEADWQRLFSSEGYVRLKKRETALRRSFEDADFKVFVLSDALAERRPALEETLAKWKRADVTGAARRALAYLPEGARIRAKAYPVIKPQENSFVFELQTDPSLFLYLDPKLNEERFENTLAHELHHVGYASSCLPKLMSEEFTKLPEEVRTVLYSIGSFGEGVAMLAAAGGPDVHPHSVSRPEDKARWDRDLANFNDDLKKVEKLFLDILEKRIAQEEIQKVSASFFGVQGPWYTVGWKMAITVEKAYGRKKLIESLCDPRGLLVTYNWAARKYNRSAREPLALWSTALIEGIKRDRP